MAAITIFTADNGNIEEYAALTRENKFTYANKWGYNFLSFRLSSDFFWHRIDLWRRALRMLDEGAWLFSIDADALFVNMDYPLQQVIDEYGEGFDLLISEDENGINHGGFLLRNVEWSRTHLERIWARRNIPVMDADGKGAFELELLIRRELAPFMWHVHLIPQEIINGYFPAIYGPEYREPVLVAHFPGKTTSERAAWIRELTSEVKA